MNHHAWSALTHFQTLYGRNNYVSPPDEDRLMPAWLLMPAPHNGVEYKYIFASFDLFWQLRLSWNPSKTSNEFANSGLVINAQIRTCLAMQNMKKTFKRRNIMMPKLSTITCVQTETVILLRELAKCFAIFCTEGCDLIRANKYLQSTLEKRKHFLLMK